MRIGRYLGMAMLWAIIATTMVGSPQSAFALSTGCANVPEFNGFFAPFDMYDADFTAGEILTFSTTSAIAGSPSTTTITVEGTEVATGAFPATVSYTIPDTRTYSQITFGMDTGLAFMTVACTEPEPTATNTPVPPTETATEVPATETPVNTATATETAVPATETATEIATSTDVPATVINTVTVTNTVAASTATTVPATLVPSTEVPATATDVPGETATDVPESTATDVPEATETAFPSAVAPTEIPGDTATAIAADTATAAATSDPGTVNPTATQSVDQLPNTGSGESDGGNRAVSIALLITLLAVVGGTMMARSKRSWLR